MRKSYLIDDKPILVVNIKQYVTNDIFTKALACFYWDNGETMPSDLPKKNGEKILKNQLKAYGYEIEEMTKYESASEETMKWYNENHAIAEEWVLKNYPHLKR